MVRGSAKRSKSAGNQRETRLAVNNQGKRRWQVSLISRLSSVSTLAWMRGLLGCRGRGWSIYITVYPKVLPAHFQQVQNPRRNSYAGITPCIEQQVPRTNRLCIILCMRVECLAAPCRPSPVSRLFHAGCIST